jgi:hypothetical protein
LKDVNECAEAFGVPVGEGQETGLSIGQVWTSVEDGDVIMLPTEYQLPISFVNRQIWYAGIGRNSKYCESLVRVEGGLCR